MSRMSVIATKLARTEPTAKTGKVNWNLRAATRTKLADTQMAVALDSPPPMNSHDELDTAE
jgi:hypothetical protein